MLKDKSLQTHNTIKSKMLQDWNSEKTKRKRIGNQSTKAQQRCFQRKHENWGCGWFYL